MSYRVTTEDGDIVIRLPKAETDEKALSDPLGFLGLGYILRRSRLSEADAAELSREVKQGTWEQVKEFFR